MTQPDLLEAAPIARILCDRTDQTTGWIYKWNNGQIMCLWVDEPCRSCRLIGSTNDIVLSEVIGAEVDDIENKQTCGKQE